MTKLSILQNFRSDLVVKEPFPHFVIDGALPGEIYERLQGSYPSPETIHAHHTRRRADDRMISNTRYDLSAAAVHQNASLDIGLWRDFVLYHTSQDFFDEMLDKLGPVISLRYGDLIATMRSKAPQGRPRAGIRKYQDDAKQCEIALDCQIGINSKVVNTPSTVKSLHLDDSKELYAGLFYLRDPRDSSSGGDLEVYRWKSATGVSFYDKRSIRPEAAELAKVIKYAPNTFAWLLNGLDAIHGVSVRSVTPFPRRLVNIIAEVYPTVSRLFDERPYQEKASFLERVWARVRA